MLAMQLRFQTAARKRVFEIIFSLQNDLIHSFCAIVPKEIRGDKKLSHWLMKVTPENFSRLTSLVHMPANCINFIAQEKYDITQRYEIDGRMAAVKKFI